MKKEPKIIAADDLEYVTAILKQEAPFDVLAQGEDVRVDKLAPVKVPKTVLNHRFAEYLIIS